MMKRLSPVIVFAALSIAVTGCFGGRPKGIAAIPGDCFCELSDPQITNANGELRFKVRYAFPDGLPKHEAYFTCTFEVQGQNTSSVTIRKTGGELAQKGEFEGATNAAFMRGNNGTLSIQVRQGDKKAGPFRAVSAPLVTSF